MNQLLPLFIILPLAGVVVSFFANNQQEKYISTVAIVTISIHLLLGIVFGIQWMANGFPVMFEHGPVLYKTNNSDFSIDFFFDATTAVYITVSNILILLVSIFSRYYMHREKGFKRFFNNLLFFYTGLNIVLLAGNFETMFIGWEILGVTSFFLIAFYNDRYLPVKNALKVVSLYRVADVALLLGIWLCHHYFQKNISFAEMNNLQAHHVTVIEQHWFQLLIPSVFLIAAMVKSAQFPFSSWLPRAMEGPSTSSAIFYGSLSVHIGVFLLIRTYPFWESNLIFKISLIVIGLLTTFMCTITARVQSSVKTQIAYSSISQIGLMWIELALGLHWLALIHFAGNAFLRCYQLLVSPSVLSYLVHDQFFNFIPPQHNFNKTLWGKLRMSVFVLSIKEWNLDTYMNNWLWRPLKKTGNVFSFINKNALLYFFIPLFAAGLFFAYNKSVIPDGVLHLLPLLFALIAVMMILRAFTERRFAKTSWLLIILNQLFTSLSVAFNEQFDYTQVHIYLSGVFVSGILGYMCLRFLRNSGESVSLDQFHGHAYEHPRLAFVFLIASLGLAGFPITPTFIGEDFIIGHIHENQFTLTALTALSLILDGLAIFRIYSRLFLGPHEKGYHETAYRSS
jgi:NADH-quinone oxidoreductase subunit L